QALGAHGTNPYSGIEIGSLDGLVSAVRERLAVAIISAACVTPRPPDMAVRRPNAPELALPVGLATEQPAAGTSRLLAPATQPAGRGLPRAPGAPAGSSPRAIGRDDQRREIRVRAITHRTLRLPLPRRHLLRGHVQAVVRVRDRDREKQGREGPLVVVPGRLPPDLVRDGVHPVTEPGDRLREGERGALRVAEVRGAPPSGDGGQALLGHAALLGLV